MWVFEGVQVVIEGYKRRPAQRCGSVGLQVVEAKDSRSIPSSARKSRLLMDGYH